MYITAQGIDFVPMAWNITRNDSQSLSQAVLYIRDRQRLARSLYSHKGSSDLLALVVYVDKRYMCIYKGTWVRLCVRIRIGIRSVYACVYAYMYTYVYMYVNMRMYMYRYISSRL